MIRHFAAPVASRLASVPVNNYSFNNVWFMFLKNT